MADSSKFENQLRKLPPASLLFAAANAGAYLVIFSLRQMHFALSDFNLSSFYMRCAVNPFTGKGVFSYWFCMAVRSQVTLIFEGCSSAQCNVQGAPALQQPRLPFLHCCTVCLHCSAALTLASVVTGLLEEYIQWAPPPPLTQFITSPRIYLWKRGRGVRFMYWSLPFPSPSGRFTQPHEKGTKCFFAYRGPFHGMK